MDPQKARILLIVPCFNEESRLQVERFLATDSNVDFLFADDGSKDNTAQIIKTLIMKNSSRCTGYFAEKNLGKGNIIQAAYQSLTPHQKQSFDWIGYWDADLATPLGEVANMLRYRSAFYASTNVGAIFASRVSRLGSEIVRSPLRHYVGRAFVTVSSMVLKLVPYDSQCGAKIFKPDVADTAFKTPFLSRWIFDLEIILRIGAKVIVEWPLMNWQDVPGSKVRVFRMGPKILLDIFRIRKHYLGGPK